MKSMARVSVSDVVGLDRGEQRDAQLVAAELAVRLDVDDAVGAQRRGDRPRRRPVGSKSIVAVTGLR